jgi:diketogulonate reductase-like aldo/keto reductase
LSILFSCLLIALRWIIEQGASVVAKSYNGKRLAQNADIFSWSLYEGDLEKISGIKPQQKLVSNSFVYKGLLKTFEEFYDTPRSETLHL